QRLAWSPLPRAVRTHGPCVAAARRAGRQRPLPSRRRQPLAPRPAARRPPPRTPPPYRPPAPGRAWSLKADRSRVKHNRTFHLSTTVNACPGPPGLPARPIRWAALALKTAVIGSPSARPRSATERAVTLAT